MKNLKPLSKTEMKKVVGGGGAICPFGQCFDPISSQCIMGDDCAGGDCLFNQACTHVIQGDDGSYITRSGWCAQGAIVPDIGKCYCETGLGYVPVTSNGGMSRCTRIGTN